MNKFIRYLICLPLWGAALSLSAQELEPRRWAHLPIDTNYAGGGYAHTESDIVFDPVLRVENAEVEMDSIHLIHQFKPGQWAGLSVGFASGGKSTINGVEKDDRKQELAWALSYGFGITPRIGVKVAYVGRKTKQSTGIDSDSLAIGLSTFW